MLMLNCQPFGIGNTHGIMLKASFSTTKSLPFPSYSLRTGQAGPFYLRGVSGALRPRSDHHGSAETHRVAHGILDPTSREAATREGQDSPKGKAA